MRGDYFILFSLIIKPLVLFCTMIYIYIHHFFSPFSIAQKNLSSEKCFLNLKSINMYEIPYPCIKIR